MNFTPCAECGRDRGECRPCTIGHADTKRRAVSHRRASLAHADARDFIARRARRYTARVPPRSRVGVVVAIAAVLALLLFVAPHLVPKPPAGTVAGGAD